MDVNTDVRKGRHVVTELHLHLVFVTKYRRGVFTHSMLSAAERIMTEVCSDFDAELVTFGGEDDHVHLLVQVPPTVTPSKLVNSLKGVSSRMLRKEFGPQIRSRLWGNHLWSRSYYIGSVGGPSIESVHRYIGVQRVPLDSPSA